MSSLNALIVTMTSPSVAFIVGLNLIVFVTLRHLAVRSLLTKLLSHTINVSHTKLGKTYFPSHPLIYTSHLSVLSN
jgi:hypothetical protein